MNRESQQLYQAEAVVMVEAYSCLCICGDEREPKLVPHSRPTLELCACIEEIEKAHWKVKGEDGKKRKKINR